MSFPFRPAARETDEDLLKLQDAFLTNKSDLSVKIKKTSGSLQGTQKPESAELPSSSTFKEEDSDDQITNTSSVDWKSTPSWITPPPVKIDKKMEGEEGAEEKPVRKKSLFALRVMKSRADAKKLAEKPPSEVSESAANKFGNQSYIITGKDANEIHQQNTDKLSSMSDKEIEEARQHFLSQLSSSTIKFVMSRRKNSELPEKSGDSALLDKQSIQSLDKPTHVSSSKAFSSTLNELKEPSKSKDVQDMYDTLPINPNEAKQWLNMNVVEKDKLEWMKDLNNMKSFKPPVDPYSARFNFDGLLLPYYDEAIEVNKGLHHHGEEPERPGYTLQELMQLSRSSVQQQRVLGLTTLGNILLKFKLGIYDEVLQQNVLKELLDAGIFLLLRFSMDDSSTPVVFAALTAMRNLLFNEPDEASLDFCLGCEGGLFHPILSVPYEDKDFRKIQEQKEQEAELKDFEIIQLDVLKGAQRTNLIVRLGYILDVLKGPPGTVLDVLIRIARHSQELAEAVVSCGGLLRTIRDELLTTRVVSALAASSEQSGYGEPSAKALRFMRVLAAHSRTVANTLLDKFNIMEPVMTYVSMSSPELPHIQSLVIGGFYLWQTFLSYGLASQTIIDLYPILMRQLHFHAQLTSAVGETASTPGHELATALAGIVELCADILCAGHTTLEARPIFQLGKILTDCTQKWLTQMSAPSADKPVWSSVKMVGAALNSLAKLAKFASKQDTTDAHSFRQKLESLTFEKVFPFLKSHCLQYLLSQLMPCSFLLDEAESGQKRDPSNLPSLGAIEWGGSNLVPGLHLEAPHPLLSGLLQYLIATHELFGSSTAKFEGILLDNISLEKYLLALVTRPLKSCDQWFSRQEVYMLCHLLHLVTLKPSAVQQPFQIRYYQLALCLVDLIQTNDKNFVTSIFFHAIFNSQFLRWGTMYASTASELSFIIEECASNLATIQSIYGDVLGTKFSRVPAPSQKTSLMSQNRGMEPTLPIDWHYAPLLLLYGQYNAQNRRRASDGDSVTMVVNCLRFLLLVESLWPDAQRPLSVTARWCRLSLVFLSGSDFFFDVDVKRLLKINVACLLKKNGKLNFNEEIPGLTSFSDLYKELLLQFSAVSYGDRLFGAFLLVPLQQTQDYQLRCMVWGEFAMVLRSLSTSIDEVYIPMENFLQPCETDNSLLNCYLEALAKGYVQERWCPVLYKVALHHVAAYVRTQPNNPFGRSLCKRIESLGNKELRDLFLNYGSSS